MKCPLGSPLANIFLFIPSIWLHVCPREIKPLFYRRYVDHCFLLFRSQDQVTPFLDYLNSKHPNIKFTQETELNRNCLFLISLLIVRTSVSPRRYISNPPSLAYLPSLTLLSHFSLTKVQFFHC